MRESKKRLRNENDRMRRTERDREEDRVFPVLSYESRVMGNPPRIGGQPRTKTKSQ